MWLQQRQVCARILRIQFQKVDNCANPRLSTRCNPGRVTSPIDSRDGNTTYLMQLIIHNQIFLLFEWLPIQRMAEDSACKLLFRSLPVVKVTTWCSVPSLPHLSEALGISFSTLQTHPLSSFVHSSSTLYPLTDSQIISPHRMPPSDIHSTDMQPSPWLWPSSDHELLFRGQNKRRLQRLQRIFRAKRNGRLWIYFMSLFQLHGFHIIIKKKKRVTLKKMRAFLISVAREEHL
jgi:hypothetical protein